MIKEFALGLNKRHYFQPADNIDQWQGLNQDTFILCMIMMIMLRISLVNITP